MLFYKRGARGTRLEVVESDALAFLGEFNERMQRSGGFLGLSQRRVRRAKVFISYERRDDLLAQRVFAALQTEQLEAALDHQFLSAGDNWNLAIEDRVRNCDYFVVLHSDNLVTKLDGYVNKEINIAPVSSGAMNLTAACLYLALSSAMLISLLT